MAFFLVTEGSKQDCCLTVLTALSLPVNQQDEEKEEVEERRYSGQAELRIISQ